MSESFTYSQLPNRAAPDSNPPFRNAPKVCFSCQRPIRDWETGYTNTGLCEDCQVEAEEQAALDNAACQENS